ncbi:hypothetical protein OPQ81_006046 [Rhizoctonia solani]|nr:hypothetical protein OPQ81_006046 [Rhizoctonia solani]
MSSKTPPKDYGGRAGSLGRDDPVWPCYVAESTKHDANLVDAWNKNMDVLLVVTAFLIESFKSLKPDVAYITAASVSRLVELHTSGRSSNTAIPLPSLYDFKPTGSDILINSLWFCSLALSMTVALITMLVKQWAERYLHGRYFTVGPYYVQARTRQARYNNLDRTVLKMRYVVQSLQIMMHTALGLFLSGLTVLLKSSSRVPMLWILVAGLVFLAFSFYLYITLMPLVVAFCPYHTPFSSRRLSHMLVRLVVRRAYWLINKVLTPSDGLRALPWSGEEWSKKSARRDKIEWEISTSVTPDKLTAEAVVWLISYSQDTSSVDTAIRAVADANAGPELWDHLVQPELVALIAQRFTSFFKETLDQSNTLILSVDDLDLMQAASCSRALAKIERHSKTLVAQGHSHLYFGRLSKPNSITLPEDQLIAVQQGLLRQVDMNFSSSGFCGASAWWTSLGHKPYQCNEHYGPLLSDLIKFLEDKATKVGVSLLVDLVQALGFEISYMSRELQDGDMANVFHSVFELCSKQPTLLKGAARGAMATVLAVIAALLNDYPPIDSTGSRNEDKLGIPDQYKMAWEAYKEKYPLDVDEDSNPRSPHLRQWRAAWIAEVCAKNPKYLEEHSDALLFLGLGGILRSLRMDSAQFDCVAKLFTEQLQSTPITQASPVTLPCILSPTCNVRSIVAESIITAFRTQPSDATARIAFEKTKSELLQALSAHGQWIDFRSDLLVGVLQILESTKHGLLLVRCLIALDRYWFLHSTSGLNVYNLPLWQLLVDFRLIEKWANIFYHADELARDATEEERTKLRQCTISCFAKFARTVKIQWKPRPPPIMSPNQSNPPATVNQVPTQSKIARSSNMGNTANQGLPTEILRSLEQLLLNHSVLFETFAKSIVCGAIPEGNADLTFWKDAILCLPNRLAASSTSQTQLTSSGDAGSALPVPAASSSSQIALTSTNPQASITTTATQVPIAPSGQNATASPIPPISSKSTSSQVTTTDNLQVPMTSVVPSSMGSSQTPTAPQTTTTRFNPHISSSPGVTSPGVPASTSSNPEASASITLPTPPVTPMTHDQARAWLLKFANDNANAQGTLGEMSGRLRYELSRNP